MILDSNKIQNARLAQQYLDIAEVLIMALDENHRVTMINQKGVSILGYAKEEILGKNFMENFLPPRIQEEINKLGQEIIGEKKEFRRYYENPILTKSGEERLIAWKNTQLKDENGNPIGILTSGEDITELRRKSQQLLQKSRLEQMGEMMSMIAHQWRQPLGAISSVSAGLLIKLHLNEFELEKEEGIPKLKESLNTELKKINTYVQNLSNTIDDFKNFYKVDKVTESTQPAEVVESSLNIINPSLKDTNITFIKEYKTTADVEIFYSEMTQVILSIIENSRENFEERKTENPEIKISIKNKKISISDNGGGIAEHIIYRIFDPYFSTKEEKNGTGLGLYMSKMIVEEHHKGTLSVENIENGVCFHIDLKK